jgi:hypothetical protein
MFTHLEGHWKVSYLGTLRAFPQMLIIGEDTCQDQSVVFVNEKHFQPCLIFESGSAHYTLKLYEWL